VLWGVDSSYVHADMMVNATNGRPLWRYERRPGGSEITLYEFVRRKMGMGEGQHPDFWGRYLNPQGHRREATRLRSAEKDFIFSASGNHCKILLVYNGISADTCRVRGDRGYRNGFHQAQTAIWSARSLSVPSGVRLYANIEGPWRISPNWIQGWWDAMALSEYAGLGGIYGRGAELRWRDRNDPLVRVRRTTALSGSVPNASWDRTWGRSNRGLDAAMRHGGRRGSRRPPGTCYIWTNMPRHQCRFPRDSNRPELFQGVGPATTYTRVLIWQYSVSCFPFPIEGQDEEQGAFDLNLAMDEAGHDMWCGA
jgi:hypothetical protein